MIKRTVFVLIVKNIIKNQKFNFSDKLRHTKKMLKNKIVCFKKIYKSYFDHSLIGIICFKSRSSDIVLLKLGNLHENAKRYEARNTEREARDENVRAKRADFYHSICL